MLTQTAQRRVSENVSVAVVSMSSTVRKRKGSWYRRVSILAMVLHELKGTSGWMLLEMLQT
jgi:hypothetical protein